MYRAVPVPSKILNKKWEEKEQDSHQSRLKQIKKTMHIEEPRQFKYLYTRPKRTQKLEGKFTKNFLITFLF